MASEFIKVTGLNRVRARLLELPNILPVVSVAETRAVLELIKQDAVRSCPVGTPQSTGIPGYIGGSLRKSIRIEHRMRGRGKTLNMGVAVGGYIVNPNTGKLVHYALWVEHGTSTMVARPFLRNAILKHQASLPRRIVAGIRSTMK